MIAVPLMSRFCQQNSHNYVSAFLLAQGVFKHNSDCRVYTPNTGAAVIKMCDIVAQAEHSHPDSFAIVTGDFNKANPKKEMPMSYSRSHVQQRMVYLVPNYKQQLKCAKAIVNVVKQWSVNAVEILRGCF